MSGGFCDKLASRQLRQSMLCATAGLVQIGKLLSRSNPLCRELSKHLWVRQLVLHPADQRAIVRTPLLLFWIEPQGENSPCHLRTTAERCTDKETEQNAAGRPL